MGRNVYLSLFNKECNQLLIREVVTCNGSRRFCPHRFYCYSSLVSDLQSLVLRCGFIDKCEMTGNMFSTSDGFSDVYDGSIWKEFRNINHLPFLSHKK